MPTPVLTAPPGGRRWIDVEDVAPSELVRLLCEGYPLLPVRRGSLRLAVHLLRTPVRSGAAVPIPYEAIAAVVENAKMAGQKRFSAHETVRQLADALDRPAPGAPQVDVFLYPHNFRRHIARAVEFVGLDDRITTLASASRDVPDDNRITLSGWTAVTVSGTTRGLYHDSSERRQRAKQSIRPDTDVAEMTAELKRHLNDLNPSVLAPLREAISEPATGVFVGHTFGDRTAREHVTATLLDILRQPVPIYQTSPNTPRIHAVGRGLTTLRSSVRHHLTERLGWVELDLAHAQLACNAAAWEVEVVLGLLRQEGYRLWDDLLVGIGIADPTALRSNDRALYDDVKSLVKQAVHGVSFGMTVPSLKRLGITKWTRKGNLRRNADIDLAEAERVTRFACGCSLRTAGERLRDHVVVGEMLRARKTQSALVRAEGGRTDSLGTWHPIDEQTDWKQVLARVAQAEETALLSSVIQDAISESRKKRPAYRIVAWQHDGFTVSPKGLDLKHRQRVARRLQKLVAAKADAMGIPTRLVVDVGQGLALG